MTTLDIEILAATAWLREQAVRTPFGEIAVRFVLHAGRLSRVERTITEKSQPMQVPTLDEGRK